MRPSNISQPKIKRSIKISIAVLTILAVTSFFIESPEITETRTRSKPTNFFSYLEGTLPMNFVEVVSASGYGRYCYTMKGNQQIEHPCDEDEGEDPPVQPPSISSNLNCSTWGNNNWCVGSLSLDLTATEPQGSDVLISGDVNGTVFACPTGTGSANCSIPLPEGTGTVQFAATSITGLTDSGSISFYHDITQPLITGAVSGTEGNNGWYISPVEISASISDPQPGSGVAVFQYSLNGGDWENFGGPMTLMDGIHSLSLRASDVAGNVVETSQTFQVDTITPVLDLSITGTSGMNGWYVTAVEISAVATDDGSGLAIFEASANGGAWAAYTAPLAFSDGGHSYQFRATDNAGNLFEVPIQGINVDTIPPAIDLPPAWRLGDNAMFKLQDNGSGLAGLRLVIEDEEEIYPKVAWVDDLSGNKFGDSIAWNGHFKDGSQALPGGEYYAWLKVTDNAGNEKMQAGQIIVDAIVPLPIETLEVENSSVEIVPSAGPENPTSISPLPSISSSPPVTNFGGGSNGSQTSAVQTGEKSFSAGSMTTSPTTDFQSSVLWGASATAAIGAFAAEIARRKQEEEEAKQARRIERNGTEPKARKLIAMRYQASLRNFNAQLKQAEAMGMSRQEAEKLKKDVANTGKIGISLNNAQNFVTQKVNEAQAYAKAQIDARLLHKEELLEPEIPVEVPTYIPPDVSWKQQDYAQLEHAEEVAAQAKVTSQNKVLMDDKENTNLSIIENPLEWLQQTSFYTNVFQPLKENVYVPFIQPLAERAKQTQIGNTISNLVTPKNIALTVIAAALGAGTIQWVNNIISTPDIFLPAQTHAQSLVDEYSVNYPPAPENKTFSYLLTHPYDILSKGADVLDALTSVTAAYADIVWQQNPLVQAQISSLEALENSSCSNISNQAWGNRCTGGFYLAAGLTATPFDTTLGVMDSFVVAPIEGLIKQIALSIETYEALPNLVKDVQENGLQGAKEFTGELINKNLSVVLNDKQVQSALFFEALGLLALVAAPVAGGVVLGMTANSLIGLDTAVTTAKDKKSLIELVTSHDVRTTVVSSVLVLALMAVGFGNKISEFKAFQESLSPTGQTAFAKLSLLEQTRLVDLATKMELSPSAFEVYLSETARSGSPLAELPINDALRLSQLIDQSGEGTFILDYVSRFGFDNALQKTFPETVKQYVELTKADGSALHRITPQQGLDVVSGKVVQLEPEIAMDLAAELTKITGKNAWVSETNGMMYLSSSSPRAIAAMQQLIAEGITSPNAKVLIRIIAEESVRGSGDKFELGPFLLRDPETGLPQEVVGVEKGVYIQDSLNNGNKFFDVGEVWSTLEDAGFSAEELWSINQEAIQITMEAKNQIDFVFTDVDTLLLEHTGRLDADVPIRVREMRWIRDHAGEFGYKQDGNHWIWQPNQ